MLKIVDPVVAAKVVLLLQRPLHAQSQKWDAMTLAHAATVVNLKNVVVSRRSASFKTGFYGAEKR